MSKTRSTVELWEDLSWLQGAAGDGGFVRSEMVRTDELAPGCLVRHVYRRTCVDGSELDESGWWMVDNISRRDDGYGSVTALWLNRLDTGTADSRHYFDVESIEVRTDTRIAVS